MRLNVKRQRASAEKIKKNIAKRIQETNRRDVFAKKNYLLNQLFPTKVKLKTKKYSQKMKIAHKTSQNFCTQSKRSKYASNKKEAMLGSQNIIMEEKIEYWNIWPKTVTKFINFRKFSQSKHYFTK